MRPNYWLVAGGTLSSLAALLHLAVIVGGPSWYRFFGAGEGMARMAEQGSFKPVAITLLIAAVLAIWAAYAFSGAALIRRLPLLRTGLVVISLIYLARGVGPFLMPFRVDLGGGFIVWSSLIVLIYGVVYAAGTWTAWPHLAPAAER